MPRIDGGKLDVLETSRSRRELEDFVAAVRDGRAAGVTGEQGRAALVLANDIVSRMGNPDMIDLDIDSAITSRAMAGETLSQAELEELDGVDVLALGMLADDVRRSRVGDTVELHPGASSVGATGLPAAGELAALLPLCGEVRLAALGDSLEATAAVIRDVRAAIGPTIRLTRILAGRPDGA